MNVRELEMLSRQDLVLRLERIRQLCVAPDITDKTRLSLILDVYHEGAYSPAVLGALPDVVIPRGR